MDRLRRALGRAADAVRRNERLAAWLLLGAIGLGCVAFLTPPIRNRILVRAQVAATRWEARWTDRIERGEALLAEGRYEEAAIHLERLDHIHPARTVNHGRDVERERVLRGLGTANLELGRKRASLNAFRRAAEFDERNYLNHFALAGAAMELGEPDESLVAYGRVLAIHPNHLATVAALVAHYFEGSDYRSVVDAYEAYLDAYLIQEATVRLGDGVGRADLLVNGRVNLVDVALVVDADAPPAEGNALVIEDVSVPFVVDGVQLVPPRRPGSLDASRIDVAIDGGWVSGTEADTEGERPPHTVSIPLENGPVAAARAWLAVRVLKPADAETWAMVERSYRNLLETEALADARARTALPGDSATTGAGR